ncbi:hypothetical protein [Chitinophaga sancti]|uniref:Uncharacterized protein n=1 Tax=Chitinophaga sancti TaxID=1004 RepID=A0A1K1LQI9_9BACT|nr:hypothetical protein [Chitinophaga sancti]WQD64925.1 hypothetical protein U0033_11020 [Chitinophaga sancti]WQG89451.1 hypothetical protein SR876_31450 [Chitinophaga sancti]SFW13153.1 hypothetical protein SAMN05661012_00136 [Chitinophaga sancti]
MESHAVKIIDILDVPHNVKCLRQEKPGGYSFVPGQATFYSRLGKRTAPFLTNP